MLVPVARLGNALIHLFQSFEVAVTSPVFAAELVLKTALPVDVKPSGETGWIAGAKEGGAFQGGTFCNLMPLRGSQCVIWRRMELADFDLGVGCWIWLIGRTAGWAKLIVTRALLPSLELDTSKRA
jgi:hypothetical protein